MECPLCNDDERYAPACPACGGTGELELQGCKRVLAGDGMAALSVLGRIQRTNCWPVEGGQSEQTSMCLEAEGFYAAEIQPDER